MRRVTSLDAAMLYAETREMPMHTMGVVILEPSPEEPPFQVMRRRLEERMHLLPPLRRRLVQGPLELGDPHWIEDPAFDLENHLRRAAIPSPGSMRELAEFAGELAGRPLERSRPLWEMVLVEGVEGGRIAIVVKVHHAAMDGGQVVALLLGCLFDPTPEGGTVPPPEEAWTPDREPSLAWFAADTARSFATRPLRAFRAIADVATRVGRTPPARRSSRGQAASLFEAPATPFNGALSPARSVALADVAFDDFRTIKRAFGTTINDVVLAASCAALRSWLLAHGGIAERPLVVNVPVTVRTEGQEHAGNRVSMILVRLPVEIDDPVERLLAISAETRRAKTEHGQAGDDVFRRFTDVLMNITVPWLLTHAMELYSSTHVADRLPSPWNLVISNLPGPAVPLYCGGARVVRVYPLGPVQQGSGLNLTVLSTMGRMCFGAMACKEMVPDVGDLATGFVGATETMRKRAEQRR
ncbi:MAG: wax ester/triacylglycerol synthase family O-acyltransferase [Myxococcota bacterium]